MLHFFSSRAALILLSTTLAVFAVACRQDRQTALSVESHPLASTVNTTPPPSVETSSLSQTQSELATPKFSEQPSSFERGLDLAMSAFTISQSAQSLDDWKLVTNQYQDAIALMKKVQRQSPYFTSAQNKIKDYQRRIQYAQERAINHPLPQVNSQPSKSLIATKRKAVVPKHTFPSSLLTAQNQPSSSPLDRQQVNAAIKQQKQPEVFIAPIKRRVGGTPIIEVTFNGSRRFEMILDTGASGTVITQKMADALGVLPVGKAKANTASAKAVEFSIGYVDSIQVSGVVANKVAVAIAPDDLQNGLLGHDFFGNYDITIKRDVVEFRPQSNSQNDSPESEANLTQ